MAIKGKFSVGVITLESDNLLTDVSQVAGYLTDRIGHARTWIANAMRSGAIRENATEPVEVLRRKLATAPVPKRPVELTVTGTFVPALLLSSGWWERNQQENRDPPRWHDPLQAWLFQGFEQWGPSWDVSSGEDSTSYGYVFGQLGHGDEANSLPVIVPRSKAKAILEAQGEGEQAFEVSVSAALLHRSHLDAHLGEGALRRMLSSLGKPFEYCLRLTSGERSHKLIRRGRRAKPGIYSGYLWACYAPKAWVFPDGTRTAAYLLEKPPALENIFFVCEHADFTQSDAIKYHLDGLDQKRRYLERRYGKLILLQKSSEVVPGKPVLPRHLFYEYLSG